jgi:phenylalanyl-tRNA synthetase alpha chain
MLLRSLPAHRLLPARRLGHARPRALATASGAAPPKTLRILGADYATDEWTNVTPAILSKLGAGLTASPGHPLTTLRALVESAFPRFAHAPAPPPLVTPAQNFDSLSFPADHPGRARSDTYYVNAGRLLRTHTSAHEVELFARGADAWTLTADVYRRDEVDARHSPVFHQTEGARVFGTDAASMKALAEENAALGASLAHARIVIEDVAHVSATNPAQAGHDPAHAALVAQNLKLHLNALMLTLFGPGAAGAGEPLRVRWIEASFPFTTPSFEVEVFFGGRWLEILGCGVVQQATLTNAGARGCPFVPGTC